MKGLPLLFYGISFLFNAVQSQETFSIKLSEEVTVVNSLSNDGCFNRTIKATSRNLTSQLSKFKLSRGVIRNVAYEGINPLGKGGSLLSFKAEFTCCSIFCKTFRRKISEWIWVSGSVKIDVVEEPSAGIYYNDALMCHSNYLEGFFAGVQFTPFELEGEAKECINAKGKRHFKTYSAVGNVERITAESSSSTITVKFAFSLTHWSKNFMLKFMKENEHGTLVNINADIMVKEVKYRFLGIEMSDLFFMALTGFALLVVFFALIIVICMRTRRGFLNTTWAIYDEYMKLKQRQHSESHGTDNIALENI